MSKFTQTLSQFVIIYLIGVAFCVKNSISRRAKALKLAQISENLINISQDLYKDYKKFDCERSDYNDCDKEFCKCLVKSYKELPCYRQINGNEVYWYCEQDGKMVIQTDEQFLNLRNSW